MYLNNKKVFIAGATGMVGSGIIKYILEHYPDTIIRAIYHRVEPFVYDSRIEYVKGDLVSLEDCKAAAKGCDCAIMAAARTANSKTINLYPERFINENLIMNMNLLEALHEEGIKRAVYIGSAILYQDLKGSIKEDDLDLNKDPYPSYFSYGWVVRSLEKLCTFWHKNSNIEMIIVRASNIFGPYARFDPEDSNFIPAIIRNALDKMDPFDVWGNPDVIRDVIYSDDFARAIAMLLDNNEIKFDIFNVGSGEETRVSDVVRWALKYTGHKPKTIRYNSDKPTTMNYRALDCSKVRRILKWEPQISIEEGIERTVDWWVENKEWWKR